MGRGGTQRCRSVCFEISPNTLLLQIHSGPAFSNVFLTPIDSQSLFIDHITIHFPVYFQLSFYCSSSLMRKQPSCCRDAVQGQCVLTDFSHVKTTTTTTKNSDQKNDEKEFKVLLTPTLCPPYAALCISYSGSLLVLHFHKVYFPSTSPSFRCVSLAVPPLP